jgi:hypothetical protein
MDPLSALGLASNVIQITDFVGRFLSKSREIYESTDGITEDYRILEDSAKNLSELLTTLSTPLEKELGKHSKDLGSKPTDPQLVQPGTQLVQLCKECKNVTASLLVELDRLKPKGSHGKLQSVYQAIRQLLSDRKILPLEKKLDDIRKQVDTVLLISLKYAVREFRMNEC